MMNRWLLLSSCALLCLACEVDAGGDDGRALSAQDAGGSHVNERPWSGGNDGATAGAGGGEPAAGGWGEAGSGGGVAWAEGDAGVGGSSPPPTQPHADMGRIIQEADVLELREDRLYALSRGRGLFIIDASEPHELRLLGSHALAGEAFEMYLSAELALILTAERGEGARPSSARLVSLDISDPSRVRALDEISMAGAISDTRLVGTTLYAATYEDCSGCGDREPQLLLHALDVSAPEALVQADQLRLEADDFAAPSLHLNRQRAYLADKGGAQTQITVIDISDPSGRLRRGASVTVHGLIESRWQMNEHQGILRVISQTAEWGAAPRLETFEVNPDGGLSPLGRLDLVLPQAEDLRSVRFDGQRAYAVTFPAPPPIVEEEEDWEDWEEEWDERDDPLFILDLSDPSRPQQRGELIIPGWIYHMEPRGDRLVAVGLSDEWGSSLSVSLYDVSDMDTPTQLSRIDLEGTGDIEGQDQVHKAFKVDAARGLILMPFQISGALPPEDARSGLYQSGIQIIDWTMDMLLERGVAYHRGVARRSLLSDNWLFAFSDERVESFDIALRSHPEFMSEVAF